MSINSEKAKKQEEKAFWARLSKFGPEAVDAVKKLIAAKNAEEKTVITDNFNRGRDLDLGAPFFKDYLNLPGGSRIKVYTDSNGNINLGWSI